MGIACDALMQIKAQLCDRIDELAEQLPHMNGHQLAHQVDEVRRIARAYGLLPVEELARGLESALSTSECSIMVLPFLETMRDAVGCERVDAAAAQSYLAAVNQRLYG
jgi:hypothetical protein